MDSALRDEILRLHVQFISCGGIERYETATKIADYVPLLLIENRALREQVQELERQRDWLAGILANCCTASKCPMCWDESCPLSLERDILGNACMYAKPKDWIKAAKEAGE